MTHPFLLELAALAGIPASEAACVHIEGSDPVFASPYKLGEAGAAAIGAAALAAAELYRLRTGERQDIAVDAVGAAAVMRGNHYLRIDDEMPARPTDPITGFYELRNGRWIYLHCNFFNLRDRALGVLGAEQNRESVAARVKEWDGPALEQAIVDAGGCCAFVRSEAEWDATEQAAAVAAEPLFQIIRIGDAPPEPLPEGDRPLSGIRALDLTRVLAGPTCGRTFAEHGADVLRIARPDLADSGIFDLDTGVGKLSTFLDFRKDEDHKTMQELLKGTDIFLQSYRPGTLAARGFSPEDVAALRPGVVCVTLDAWGFTGPWKDRRGYDTVVQSANGLAWRGEFTKPVFMPVSAQDYLAGYLMAFATMVALRRRATEGGSWLVRLSLAGMGHWLRSKGAFAPEVYASAKKDIAPEVLEKFLMTSDSPVGRLTHLAPGARMSKTPARWARPAVPLGTHAPEWP